MTVGATDPIVIALAANDPVRAERLCRQRLAQTPADGPDLMVLLATSFWRQGRQDEALDVYARLTRLDPDSAVHWGNYATALRLAGNLPAAEQAALTALRLTPDEPVRLERLGLLQLQRNKPREARDNLLRALARSPQSPALRIHAARACAACRDDGFEHLIEPWRNWLPLEDSLQYDLADLLILSGEAEAARQVLEDLVRRAPAHWRAQLLLAWVYERVNRLADAEAVLERVDATAAGEDDQRARVDLALQRARLALRKHDPARARAILEPVWSGKGQTALCGFLLARACDQLGDVDATMQVLAIAHARQVEELKVAAPQLLAPDADLLPHVTARVRAADYRAWPALEAPDAAASPVFIVGFPRSGTTLLEQMLDAHPRLQSMDERPFVRNLVGRFEGDMGLDFPRDLGNLDQRRCDELRQYYRQMVEAKLPNRRDARLVDKNPLNMLWLPMIHRLFPRAKFILALRHPCDVILSCYQQNFHAAALAAASQSLERLARTYVAAMETWLHHAELMQPDVCVSRYADLVADPAAQSRRIASFLELDDADAMLGFVERAREKAFIATPSYTQVIEPINTKRSGRWQQYRDYLKPVLPILQPMLDHWGYKTQADVP
ncbi:MAG TPA: sulfotransferase [Rhodanobacteraceae bacterium]|nr:sulfotransferase [Rhodanobacteraceae bacterium]